MIQTRMALAMDGDISRTQYRFRKAKSTSEPVACVRRIIDKAEATQNTICLTFLDWKKAFDNRAR